MVQHARNRYIGLQLQFPIVSHYKVDIVLNVAHYPRQFTKMRWHVWNRLYSDIARWNQFWIDDLSPRQMATVQTRVIFKYFAASPIPGGKYT